VIGGWFRTSGACQRVRSRNWGGKKPAKAMEYCQDPESWTCRCCSKSRFRPVPSHQRERSEKDTYARSSSPSDPGLLHTTVLNKARHEREQNVRERSCPASGARGVNKQLARSATAAARAGPPATARNGTKDTAPRPRKRTRAALH
jgi:hypothetical protein